MRQFFASYHFDCRCGGSVHGWQLGRFVSVNAKVGAAELREVNVDETVGILAQHVLPMITTLLSLDRIAQ